MGTTLQGVETVSCVEMNIYEDTDQRKITNINYISCDSEILSISSLRPMCRYSGIRKKWDLRTKNAFKRTRNFLFLLNFKNVWELYIWHKHELFASDKPHIALIRCKEFTYVLYILYIYFCTDQFAYIVEHVIPIIIL